MANDKPSSTPRPALDYQRDEHRVHHPIWIPMRRKPVLTGPIATDCRNLIEQKWAEKGWTVMELAIQPENSHRCVRVWPTDAAADGVKDCKGHTAYELRKKYPAVLKKLPSLWTRSYLASTAGHVSAATLEHDIASQRGL